MTRHRPATEVETLISPTDVLHNAHIATFESECAPRAAKGTVLVAPRALQHTRHCRSRTAEAGGKAVKHPDPHGFELIDLQPS